MAHPTSVHHRDRVVATALWRRLDTPGHDACSLARLDDGWQLAGTAVFRAPQATAPVHLRYVIDCADDWCTRRGVVDGWWGERRVSLVIGRAPSGHWTLQGATVPGLDACRDLDLSFTPATNLLQLNRTSPAVGVATDIPVAWLHIDSGDLLYLPQRYERHAAHMFLYSASTLGFTAELAIDDDGFVRSYPGLWTRDA